MRLNAAADSLVALTSYKSNLKIWKDFEQLHKQNAASIQFIPFMEKPRKYAKETEAITPLNKIFPKEWR